jgi:outer membrane protein TolC
MRVAASLCLTACLSGCLAGPAASRMNARHAVSPPQKKLAASVAAAKSATSPARSDLTLPVRPRGAARSPAAGDPGHRVPDHRVPDHRVPGHAAARPASHRRQTAAPLPEQVPAPPAMPPNEEPQPASMPIDLPTALRLADADNLQVAMAREQIRQALARVAAAKVLWLPSIRTGVNYNRHDGSIQAVQGNQFNTSRSAVYAGLGAGTFGAGPPLVPGVYANFNLADAFFQPLAARQFTQAQRRAAAAVTNDTLLTVAQTYLELLRASQDQEIARGIADQARQLARLTTDYAQSGEGLQSDADRLHVELSIRTNDVFRAEESRQVASTRLSQLLHLDPTLALEPVEPVVVPIKLVADEDGVRELVVRGLSARPELAESRSLVSEAVARLRRERLAPLVPSILLGTSYGAMGAGISPSMAPAVGRLDLDAVAYWEVRGLGLGDRASRQSAASVLRQARLRQIATMDLVAREITEAYSQSQSRRKQIAVAREGIEAAMNLYERSMARVEHGKGVPIEVLQAVQVLAMARREYLRAVIDYNLAQFTLHRALGWPARPPSAIDGSPKHPEGG